MAENYGLITKVVMISPKINIRESSIFDFKIMIIIGFYFLIPLINLTLLLEGKTVLTQDRDFYEDCPRITDVADFKYN